MSSVNDSDEFYSTNYSGTDGTRNLPGKKFTRNV